jgi:diguanylate cyclase (GGDEF)-like protein
MIESPQDLDQELEALYQSYIEKLPQKIEGLEEIWGQLQVQWDACQLTSLQLLTHELASSCNTYGFENLGRAVTQLETSLKPLLATTLEPSPVQKAVVSTQVAALQQLKVETTSTMDDHTPDIVFLKTANAHPLVKNRLIFLVEKDPKQAHAIALQIGHYGYTVQVFDRLDWLEKALVCTQPAATIMDLSFAEVDASGVARITEMQKHFDPPIPLIVISSQNDLPSRLRVVKAGAVAYFTKPLKISSLIDKLDDLTTPTAFEPYRILIIDDNPSLAELNSLTLKKAGMQTVVINNPLQAMQPLVDFAPDLILMDVYMPECTGIELAAVIRQQEAFVSIPIVFLSAETNIDKQMSAMQLGGDDFLTKPIQRRHLVSSVTARAQRSRTLRSFMTNDGLTGLLNHTTLKNQLDLEVDRAARNRVPLSFAMLDLDHFKKINDTYGHSTGDQVLKTLARMLGQYLRRTDIIGRYGGEEFAVILPNTTNQTALKVLDQARTNFAQIKQESDLNEFQCTFSCGIATFPDFTEQKHLNEAADKALYAAKHRGRNCIVCA